MRTSNKESNWSQSAISKVRKTAIVAVVFGAALSIAAVVFSPGFVEKYLLTNYSLGPITLRAIFRARLASGIVGLGVVGLGAFVFRVPHWILKNLTSLGRRGKVLVDHFPTVENNYRKIALSIIILFCCMAIMFILVGELNEDEGWYLYASKLVYNGEILYRDFSYTQPPVLPYVYGGLGKIFGVSLLLGRILTAVFGLVALVLTMAVAKVLSGRKASLLAGAAIALNPFVIYFMIITKTYSLGALLLVLSFFLLFQDKRKDIRYPLAVICLSLAVGVRLTIFPVLILTLVYIATVETRYFLRSAISSGVTLTAIFLPFIVLDPRATYFNILGYHLARYKPQTMVEMILGKVRAFFELLIKFPFLIPFIFLGIGLYIVPKINRRQFDPNGSPKSYWPHLLVFASFASMFLAHFVPGGSYPEYHVLNIPLAAIFAGWLFDEWSSWVTRRYKKALLAILVIGLLLFSFIGARPIHRFMDPRTSYINVSGGRLPLAEASKVSQFIRKNTSPGDKLFTTHNYLALESRRDILEGLEMGIFSFYPDWSTEKAQRYSVLNYDMVKEYIRSQKGEAVIITDKDFTHTGIYEDPGSETRESLLQLVENNYELAFTMDNFGQFGQDDDSIYVYLRKSG